jgi:hypothetical protein
MAHKPDERRGKLGIKSNINIELISGGKENTLDLMKHKKSKEGAVDELKGKTNYLGPGQANYPFFPF